MSWLFFSLLAAFLWGTGQVLLKKGFSNLSPLWSIVISASINLAIYIPFSLFNHASLNISLPVFMIIFLVTTLYIFYFYAIEKGQISFAGTVFSTYPVTTLILSAVFLHESLTVLQYSMIVLLLIGTILLSQSTKSKKKNKIRSSWVAWALFGAFTTGLGDFLAKGVLNSVSFNTYIFYYPITYVLSTLVFWTFDTKGRKRSKLSGFSWTIMGTIMLTFGLLSFSYALSVGKASLVTPISSINIAITIILAYLFLHEPITKKQFFALALIIFGIIVISFT